MRSADKDSGHRPQLSFFSALALEMGGDVQFIFARRDERYRVVHDSFYSSDFSSDAAVNGPFNLSLASDNARRPCTPMK